MKKDYSSTTPATPNGRYCYDGKAYNSTNDSCQSQSRSDYPVGSLTHSAARRSDGTPLSQTEFTNIDPLGRVLASRQTTDGLAAMNFAYQYAVGGALSGMQYPSGRWVTYPINGANRASAVRNGQSGTSYYMQNMQYKPAGAFFSATVGLDSANPWTETREYNSLLQARKLRLVKGTQKLLGLDWIYSANSQYNASQDMYEETGSDNNGNLRMEKLAHTVGTPFSVDRSFGYDTANRIGSFSEPSKSQSYGYDAFGNLWQSAASGVPELRPNGPAWFLGTNGQVTNQLSNTAYHAGGYQAQLSISYGGTNATFDAEGCLAQVAFGGVVATYDFDAEGRRVKRTDAGGNATYYVYDAEGQLMAEYGGAATGTGTQYIATDQLGSTRMVQDAQGNCAVRMDYAPYGSVVSRSGDCYANPWTSGRMFAGAHRDGATELDHMGAREYYATLGRFTSPDPENAGADPAMPGSWNMYSYAYNNPLAYLDLSGLGPCPVDSETGEEKPCLEGLWYERFYREWLDSLSRTAETAIENWNRPRQTGAAPQVTSAAAVGLGQLHHAISKAVQAALQRHLTLRNLYDPRDPRFVTRAKDLLSHRGYQGWHREYERTVVRWITENRSATK